MTINNGSVNGRKFSHMCNQFLKVNAKGQIVEREAKHLIIENFLVVAWILVRQQCSDWFTKVRLWRRVWCEHVGEV